MKSPYLQFSQPWLGLPVYTIVLRNVNKNRCPAERLLLGPTTCEDEKRAQSMKWKEIWRQGAPRLWQLFHLMIVRRAMGSCVKVVHSPEAKLAQLQMIRSSSSRLWYPERRTDV